MVTMVLVLIVAGVVLWLVSPYMESRILTATVVVIVLVVALVILNLFGIDPHLNLNLR